MIKRFVKKIPILGPILVWAKHVFLKTPPFENSGNFWENRYKSGGNSGPGSYGKLAAFKAEIINGLVASKGIASVIEFGCGDGNQLSLARYPHYTGFDVSQKAVLLCQERFRSDPTKQFKLVAEYNGEKADLTLSLDVIFHLVEDEIFRNYMNLLFEASSRFVLVYSSNYDELPPPQAPHLRHRQFTRYVEENLASWKLVERIPNKYPIKDYEWGSFAEFFLYERRPPV